MEHLYLHAYLATTHKLYADSQSLIVFDPEWEDESDTEEECLRWLHLNVGDGLCKLIAIMMCHSGILHPVCSDSPVF